MKLIQGSCHCGGVKFEVRLRSDENEVRRCNCSLCKKKGALMASVPMEDLNITQGEALLSLYQWHTRTAKHYFCKVCGIYTHHQRRSAPNEYAFNVACIDEGFSYREADIVHLDGASAS